MRARLELATEYRIARRFEEARAIFAQLYAEFPDDAQVNYHYAWLHDNLGEERAAVPLYERAIAIGLPEDDLRNAMLGLGSTYRSLGEYEQALAYLQQGADRFPASNEFHVFIAMTLHNLGRHAEAMELLLRVIATTTSDEWVKRYERALLFYADKLHQTWTG